jgi:hypothetical protein
VLVGYNRRLNVVCRGRLKLILEANGAMNFILELTLYQLEDYNL